MSNLIMNIWLVELLVLAVLLTMASLFFFWNAVKKAEMRSVARYYTGLGLFFLAFAVNGFLDFFEQNAIFVNDQPSLFPNLHLLPVSSVTFLLMIPILHTAFCILSYQIETFILNKSHKPLTLILALCLAFSLTVFIGPWLPESLQATWVLLLNATLVPFGAIVLFWGIFYCKIALTSAGIVRSKAFLVFFGLGFVMTGIIFDTMYRGYVASEGLAIWWYFPVLSKTVAIIGVPLLYSGFTKSD